MLEEYRKYMVESVKVVHADEPRMIAFSTYANEDGTKATTIQVHPDADSMMFRITSYNVCYTKLLRFAQGVGSE